MVGAIVPLPIPNRRKIMKKRLWDIQPNAELFSYDYDPNQIYILVRLTDEEGSKGAIVRRIASYWPYEKLWMFPNAGEEHSHNDHIVDVREFLPTLDYVPDCITVNIKETEHEYEVPYEHDILDVIKEAKKHHPSWTSMVIVIRPIAKL